jgi:hypothetical protein
LAGLITATLLTLFVLPAICRLMLKSGHQLREGEMPTAYSGGSIAGAGRVRGRLFMSIDALRDALPDYAWDQKRNLDTLAAETLAERSAEVGLFARVCIRD